MKSQVRLGTVFGVELGLHYSWFIIAVLIIVSLVAQFHGQNPSWTSTVVWALAITTGLAFFAGLFIHEISHAVVAKSRGIPIHRITLFLLGGVAQIEKEASDASAEFWMAIVGPITSAVLGSLLLLLARSAGWIPWRAPTTPAAAVLFWLGYINIALAVFNMIPAFPLDGGRVLHAVLWWGTGSAESSMRIAVRVGQIIATVFIGVGIFRFFHGQGLAGLWLTFIGWFLLQAASAALLQYQVGASLQGRPVSDLMSREYDVTDPDMLLQTFVHEKLLRTGRRFFLVMNGPDLRGVITANEVQKLAPDLWGVSPVRDAMIPVDRVHSIFPDTAAATALEIMIRENVHQLPVIAKGRIEGVISRAHILQLLQSRMELNRLPAPRAN